MIQEPIIVITAPSGSGKTTLIKQLMQALPELSFSVSACTRSPRPGEEHGRDYYFFPEEQFRSLLAQDAFIEWEMVYEGKYYGTLRSELDRIRDVGKVPLVDIDVKGALTVQQKYPERARTIFIRTPSIDILKARLISRGTETPASLEERVNKAEKELEFAGRFDHIVVNDDLDTAVAELTAIVRNYIRA